MGKQRWVDGIARSIEGMLEAASRAPVGFADAASVRERLTRLDAAWDRARQLDRVSDDVQIAAVVVAETFGVVRPDDLVLEEHIGAVSTARRAVVAVVSDVGGAIELEDRVAEAARSAAVAVWAATDGLSEPRRRELGDLAVERVEGRARAAARGAADRFGIESAAAAEAEARRIAREVALERSRDEEPARDEQERRLQETRKLEIVRLIVAGLTLAEAIEQIRTLERRREQEQIREELLRLEREPSRRLTRGLAMDVGL